MKTLLGLNWRFVKEIELKAMVIECDLERREVTLLIPEQKIFFIADAAPYIKLEKIREGKTYHIILSMYTAKIDEKVKQKMEKAAKADPMVKSMLKIVKEMGCEDRLFRLVLTDIREFYFDIVRSRFEKEIEEFLKMKKYGFYIPYRQEF